MTREKEFNKQLQNQTLDELQAQHEDMNKKLYEMRNQRAMEKKSEKPHLISQTKKDRARVLTAIAQKQPSAKERA